MGRPQQPPHAHVEPAPDEPSFACRGGCGLVWPLRLQSSFPGRCRNCLRVYKRARQTREVNRRYHLARSYGVTPEWVAQQLAATDGACPICLKKMRLHEGDGGLRRDEAVVDLDHRDGTVRGLICSACNIAIGALGDNVESLLRAVAYLQRPRTKITAPPEGAPLADSLSDIEALLSPDD